MKGWHIQHRTFTQETGVRVPLLSRVSLKPTFCNPAPLFLNLIVSFSCRMSVKRTSRPRAPKSGAKSPDQACLNMTSVKKKKKTSKAPDQALLFEALGVRICWAGTHIVLLFFHCCVLCFYVLCVLCLLCETLCNSGLISAIKILYYYKWVQYCALYG